MMSPKIKFRFYTLLGFLFAMALYAGLGTVSAGCGGATSGGSASVDTGTADPLTAVETSLYDSGTIDFPVTIAKLDSPTLEFLTVSTEAIVSAESTSAGFLRYADGDLGYRATVTGAAGAVVDASVTPYLILMANDTLVFCTLESTGATPDEGCNIDFAALGDDLYIAAVNSAQDQASPFLGFSLDSVGTFAGEIITTNTDAMDGALEKYVDAEGKTYISLDNGDATWTLVSKDVFGAGETISDLLSSKPLVVTTASSPTEAGDIVVVLLSSGEIVKFSASVAASVGATPSLVDSSGQPLYTELSWTSTSIADVGEELNVNQFLTSVPYDLIGFNSTGTVLLVGEPAMQGDGTPNGEYIRMLDPSGAAMAYTIVSSENFISALAGLGESDTLYVLSKNTTDAFFTLSRVTMPDSFDTDAWTTQWNSREVLYSFSDDPILSAPTVVVQSLDVSDTGDAVALVQFGADGNQLITFRQENSYQPEEITDIATINGLAIFSAQKVAPGGEFIVFCDATDGTNDVMAYIPSLHAQNEYVTLLELESALSCSQTGSLEIDESNFVHLYHTEGDTAADANVQDAVVDPRKNPAFDGVL